MEFIFGNILTNFREITWEGPFMFLIVILAIFAVFRQWRLLLLTLFTVVLGWGAEDIALTNLESNMQIMSLSLLIYCIGSGIVIILSIVSFFKTAL